MKTFLYLICILSSIITTNTNEVCNSNNTDQDSCLTKEEGFIHDWFSKNIPIWKKHLAQFANKENLNFLEIGTYEGKSALWLLENVLTHPTSRLTCIDPWVDYENDKGDNIFTRFSHNVKNHVEKTIIVRDYSSNALRKYEPVPTFDLIYIDGCPTAACAAEDIVLCFPLLKPGGLFIFNNYESGPKLAELERSKLAADSFIRIFTEKINVLHKDLQVIIEKIDESTNIKKKPKVEEKKDDSTNVKKKHKAEEKKDDSTNIKTKYKAQDKKDDSTNNETKYKQAKTRRNKRRGQN